MHVLPVKQLVRLVPVLALVAGALVAVTPGPATAAGPPCQDWFGRNPNLIIPDNNSAGVSDNINVPESGLVIADIDVTVHITHPFDRDLTVYLDSLTDAFAGRHSTVLVLRAGNSGDNFDDTILDDSATLPIGWGSAPFAGRFKPQEPLSTYNGETGGIYRLRVADEAGGDVGTLNSWSITVRYKSCDFDGDGVEDHSDKCLNLAAHTATGCPTTTRSLTAKYKHGRFRGALASPVASCKSHRSVTVWKVRSGADKKIGIATTGSDGTYRLTRARHVGKYYATSPRVAVTGVAECPASKASTFRIR